MMKFDGVKFNGANLIRPGCSVLVRSYMHYSPAVNDNNLVARVSDTAAYEIEVIDKSGKRFKTSVQAHTPKALKGGWVKQCSVYGEVVENDGGQITIDKINVNF